MKGPVFGALGLDSSLRRGWTQATEEGAATKDILGGDSPLAPRHRPAFFLPFSPYLRDCGTTESLGVAGSTTPSILWIAPLPAEGLERPYLRAHATRHVMPRHFFRSIELHPEFGGLAVVRTSVPSFSRSTRYTVLLPGEETRRLAFVHSTMRLSIKRCSIVHGFNRRSRFTDRLGVKHKIQRD